MDLSMSFISPYLKKAKIDGYGFGYLATENIKKNTIVIREKPLFLLEKSSVSDIFEMLNLIIRADNNKIDKYLELTPHILPSSILNESIQTELNIFKRKSDQLYNFITSKLEYDDILIWCHKYIRNAFLVKDKVMILEKGTVFNHSCIPNVIFGMRGGQVIFITTRDILKGEQLFDTYIDITDTRRKRRDRLSKQYGFDCQCDRCTVSEKKYNIIVNNIVKLKNEIFNK